MFTMYDAPSDRDYSNQFSFMERDDEDPANEPIPLDPATPDIVMASEECPFGEEHVVHVQEKIRPSRAGRIENAYDSRVA